MIDQIVAAVKDQAMAKLTGEAGVPADKAGDVVDLGKESMISGLSGAVQNGQIGEILSLFQGKANPQNSPIVNTIKSQLGSLLVSRLGLSEGIASTASNMLVPMLVQQLVGKAEQEGVNSEKGVAEMLSGDLGKNILGNLLGGGLGDKLGGFFK